MSKSKGRQPLPLPLVIIASGSPQLRERWKRALRGAFPVREVGRRADLEQAMTGVGPDVLLLDVMLSPPDGVTTMPLWQRLCPTTKIVLLTRSPNAREGVLALKAGARGYCEQDIVPSLLRKAVDRVQRGEIWVGRTVVPRLLEELALLTERRQAAVPVIVGGRLERLTHRQVEIARMIGGGSSNKEIAMRLDISLKTVKAHLTAIFRKLGFSDRLRLALFVASESFQRVKT